MPDGRQGFDLEWLRAYEERKRQRHADCKRKVAVVERSDRHESLGTAPIQKANDERIVVRVRSVRKRLLDEDNLCEKYLVDALRYCGLIPDDAPNKVKIEVSQEKCGEGEDERVTIEIC
jgi:hypothetical protein